MRQDDFVGKIVSFAKTDDTVENIVLACNVKFLFINENSVAVIASEYAFFYPVLKQLSCVVVFVVPVRKFKPYQIIFDVVYKLCTL